MSTRGTKMDNKTETAKQETQEPAIYPERLSGTYTLRCRTLSERSIFIQRCWGLNYRFATVKARRFCRQADIITIWG